MNMWPLGTFSYFEVVVSSFTSFTNSVAPYKIENLSTFLYKFNILAKFLGNCRGLVRCFIRHFKKSFEFLKEFLSTHVLMWPLYYQILLNWACSSSWRSIIQSVDTLVNRINTKWRLRKINLTLNEKVCNLIVCRI